MYQMLQTLFVGLSESKVRTLKGRGVPGKRTKAYKGVGGTTIYEIERTYFLNGPQVVEFLQSCEMTCKTIYRYCYKWDHAQSH